MKFDKIYENRDSYGMIYYGIYCSEKLHIIKSFLYDYFDSTIDARGFENRRLRLSEIRDVTSDSTVISACKYLITKNFSIVDVSYLKGREHKFIVWRTFLKYKRVRTIHRLIFTKNFEYAYRFSPDDYWFFRSLEVERMKYDGFLDFRPEWSIPYFEAFKFFKENPDFKHKK